MSLWVISIVAAAVVIYAIITFNSLVRTRQMANEAWSGIDVQLKRRSDLVPNLVDAVKGYAGHERSVLEEVTKLRGAARALLCDFGGGPKRPPTRPRTLEEDAHDPENDHRARRRDRDASGLTMIYLAGRLLA